MRVPKTHLAPLNRAELKPRSKWVSLNKWMALPWKMSKECLPAGARAKLLGRQSVFSGPSFVLASHPAFHEAPQ